MTGRSTPISIATRCAPRWSTGHRRPQVRLREDRRVLRADRRARDMALLKQQYVEDLEKARLTSPISGSDFFFTSLVPGSFATSNGWTRFGFSAGDYREPFQSRASTGRGRAAGAAFSFMGIGGRASHSGSSSHSESTAQVDSSHVNMSFEMRDPDRAGPGCAPPSRPATYWRFDQNNVVVKGDRLSDGASLAGTASCRPIRPARSSCASCR